MLNISRAPGNMVFDLFDTYTPSITGSHTAGAGQTITTSTLGLSIPSPGNGFAYYTTSHKPGAITVAMSRRLVHQRPIRIIIRI